MGMIRSQREYEQSQETLAQWRVSGERLRAPIESAGFSPEHVELCMAPHLTMQGQMQGELD